MIQKDGLNFVRLLLFNEPIFFKSPFTITLINSS